MRTTEVLVVGAGPVGLALAADLRARGVDVDVVERRIGTDAGTRAIGIHSPALALLEASGATAALLPRAVRIRRGEAVADDRTLATIRFDRLAVRHPYVAALPQSATVSVLTSLAPPVRHGVTVTGLRPLRAAVQAQCVGVDGAEEIRAGVVVVASGWAGRDLVYRPSAVRTHHYPDRYVMADVDVPGDDVARVHLDRGGVLESFPLPGGRRRLVARDGIGHPEPGDAGAAARLQRAVHERTGLALDIAHASTFRVRRAVAPALRRGRIVVVGDAAHEVSPIGGQGMNLGLLDALTLAPLVARWTRDEDVSTELERWERDRIASARHAARLAYLNTVLGRPRSPGVHLLRSTALRAGLAGPGGALFTRAYAMRLDRAARAAG